MKKLTEKKSVTAANAWGRYHTVDHQEFEIEESDIGTIRGNFLGYGFKAVRFVSRDVGKIIYVMTDNTAWTTWSFK